MTEVQMRALFTDESGNPCHAEAEENGLRLHFDDVEGVWQSILIPWAAIDRTRADRNANVTPPDNFASPEDH